MVYLELYVGDYDEDEQEKIWYVWKENELKWLVDNGQQYKWTKFLCYPDDREKKNTPASIMKGTALPKNS